MKQLHIYDFDGTLGLTLHPDQGIPKYKEFSGVDWPYTGWWSKLESMDVRFDIKLDPRFREQAIEQNKNDLCYILTSRLPRFTNIIHDICVNDGLDIPLEHILTKQNFKKTEPILNHLTGNMVCDIEKGHRIYNLTSELIKSGTKISEIYFYDDRQIEIDSANLWKNTIELLGVKFNIIHVS